MPVIYGFDLETTNIDEGTPRPLYLTAYGADLDLAEALSSRGDLHRELTNKILTPRFHGCRFVAWNSNRFDSFIIADALIDDPHFVLRPYLTRSKTLRGLRISLAEDGEVRTGRTWEFLDGISMLGLAGTKLEKFLDTFAPDHRKLTGTIDFKRGESFDASIESHREYARRDSVGLWHGMTHAQDIMLSTFGEPLGVTMGGCCIKIFAAHIPTGVEIKPVPNDVEPILRDYVVRGGYCHLMRRYDGPVWKYDVNQAYAAAMRDGKLPCGPMIKCSGYPGKNDVCFLAHITAWKPGNKIPFYCRENVGGRIRSVFALESIPDTWVTSSEYRQLQSEGWQVACAEYWQWAQAFDMRAFVDKLERIRMTCDGGPKGAIGTMIKATGNHSFGKSLEQIDPIDFLIAKDQPPGYLPFFGDGSDPMEHVWFRIDSDRRAKTHHQPQIGAFITAFVRMQIRRAAMLAPDHFLYADTDCAVFSCDVTSRLDIHPSRYGAWKVEATGEPYSLIAKKVYISGDGKSRSAKAMHADELTPEHFEAWAQGRPPTQRQLQLNNFVGFTHGADMYHWRRRKGTAVAAPKSAP